MKVLVALETCALPQYAERRRLVAETWGNRLPPPFEFDIFDGPRLGVIDDRVHLPDKTRAICLYALAHNYDWLMIVDDDVLIWPERLKVPTQGDYWGVVLNSGDPNREAPRPFCTGSFYWLSRKAIALIAAAPLDPQQLAEDQWVAAVLRSHDILPQPISTFYTYPCPCPRCRIVPGKAAIPSDWSAIAFTIRWLPDKFRGYFNYVSI